MRTGQEGSDSSQLDLFAWREPASDSVVGQAARLGDPLRPARTVPRNVAALARAALLAALEMRIDDTTSPSADLVSLIAEVERRREATAAPMLVRLCRRHVGFDRLRTVPEVIAALTALTAIGAADAAPAIMRLVEQGGLGHASVAAALRCLASVRYRPAAGLLGSHLDHENAEVREAACGLAAVIGTHRNIERLLELRKDTCAEVVDAALIALGHLGHQPVGKILESRLQTAAIDEIPKILEALLPVADEETAICLGRLVERILDENLRYIVVEALAALAGRAARAWLLRLVDDPSPAIRQMAAEALAVRDDSCESVGAKKC